uniref:Delta-hexatoxin-Hv1b n=1 Tax=Hadronyche versuta TaxID=6904 RepID=D1B_HADVE|nr:RecName: Full=Delta-hexatoxin-Hv1b; Short=Delta-HXTX-Hv1b; AltName: Full=Delta-atracotoxin-Hv1b; Short=Delta-ACTX-Hv1b [Hadronyche versuta]
CSRSDGWCGKTEDCCCPMKCIKAWYKQNGNCQNTISAIWKNC